MCAIGVAGVRQLCVQPLSCLLVGSLTTTPRFGRRAPQAWLCHTARVAVLDCSLLLLLAPATTRLQPAVAAGSCHYSTAACCCCWLLPQDKLDAIDDERTAHAGVFAHQPGETGVLCCSRRCCCYCWRRRRCCCCCGTGSGCLGLGSRPELACSYAAAALPPRLPWLHVAHRCRKSHEAMLPH